MRTSKGANRIDVPAATVGSKPPRSMYEKSTTGYVVVWASTRNVEAVTSSKETTNAKIAAATSPGRIRGSVTRRNVWYRFAPRFIDACSSDSSTPARLALKTLTTYGQVMMT